MTYAQDHETFVRFVLSVVYAEEHRLGWDPTMDTVGDKAHYDITVQDAEGNTRTYRTLEMLFDAESAQGKGTRVWKAISVENGKERGDPVVLKDCWIDRGRVPEGVIAQEIRVASYPPAGVDTHGSFLSVECHGEVYLDAEQTILDCTRPFTIKDVTSSRDTVSGSTGGNSPRRSSPLGMTHYRIVFKELCSPISEETSPIAIFQALADATRSKFTCMVCYIH